MALEVIPFVDEEVQDPTRRRAIITTARPRHADWRERHSCTMAGGVGAVVWGCNQVLDIWLAGYAVSDYLLSASVVQILLRNHIGDEHLTVYSRGLWEQIDHVRTSNGTRSDGKTPYTGFNVLKPIQLDLDRGKWDLQSFGKGEEPSGHKRAETTAKYALSLASGWGMEFDRSEHRNAKLHIQEYGLGLPQLDEEEEQY